MKQFKLPEFSLWRYRLASFGTRLNFAVLLSILAISISLFNTYRQHFYVRHSLRLLQGGNVTPSDLLFRAHRLTDGVWDVNLTLVAVNLGNRDVTISTAKPELWSAITRSPRTSFVSVSREPLMSDVVPFIVKAGDTKLLDITLHVNLKDKFFSDPAIPFEGRTLRWRRAVVGIVLNGFTDDLQYRERFLPLVSLDMPTASNDANLLQSYKDFPDFFDVTTAWQTIADDVLDPDVVFRYGSLQDKYRVPSR